ncbi:unnamed protein product, partial [Meganyctiphanes norvegica]
TKGYKYGNQKKNNDTVLTREQARNKKCDQGEAPRGTLEEKMASNTEEMDRPGAADKPKLGKLIIKLIGESKAAYKRNEDVLKFDLMNSEFVHHMEKEPTYNYHYQEVTIIIKDASKIEKLLEIKEITSLPKEDGEPPKTYPIECQEREYTENTEGGYIYIKLIDRTKEAKIVEDKDYLYTLIENSDFWEPSTKFISRNEEKHEIRLVIKDKNDRLALLDIKELIHRS